MKISNTSATHFSDVSEGRVNNFDFLRFILACMVIYTHSFVFLRRENFDVFAWLSGGQLNLGQTAVEGFFLISGFLITASWLRSRGIGDYLKKRALRIYPGFLACCLFCLLVVAPLCAYGNVAAVLGELSWGRFVLDALMLNKIQFVPALEPATGTNQLNGSLWTIKIEFECYLLTLLVGIAGLLRSRKAILLISALACVGHILLTARVLPASFPALSSLERFGPHLHFAAYYLVGAAFYLYRDRIRFAPGLFWGSVALLVVATMTRTLYAAFPLAFTYVLFYLAFHPRLRMTDFARRGDLSYGVYLYGWPVQLLVAAYAGGRDLSIWAFFLLSLCGVLPLAAASWFLVEKPALSRKAKKPAKTAPEEPHAEPRAEPVVREVAPSPQA